MNYSLKILAVLFSVTLASVSIYLVATRDSPIDEDPAAATESQRKESEKQLKEYKKELHALGSSKKMSPESIIRMADLERLIGEKEEEFPVKPATQRYFGSSKSGKMIPAIDAILTDDPAKSKVKSPEKTKVPNKERKKRSDRYMHSSKSFSAPGLVRPSDYWKLRNLLLGHKDSSQNEIKSNERIKIKK